MKTKIPVLIVAGLFLATVTKAQYGPPRDNRVVIQAHLGFPIPVPVAYNYDYYYGSRDRYDHRRDRRDGRDAAYGYYDDRRDWRAEQYERYCRENRGYRISREEFYRDRCDNRNRSYYPEQRGDYRRY
jgi:hypothetical protein